MYSASEFLKCYENVNPLPTNLSFYDVWERDALELWDLQVGESQEPLEAILSFRRNILEASQTYGQVQGQGQSQSQAQDDSWKWLITAKQVEQRTSEWYKETKNIITASEISAIWKTPRARAALIMSKVGEAAEISVKRNSAFPRGKTGPMDWGVRYEPVVKQILETTLGAKIQELGRIRHRDHPRVAASPDGLIVEAADPKLVGTLVEIKCPPTRVINDKIPFDYWCQMQLQMEVCDRPSCEFVEVKFKELDADATSTQEPALHGWIILEGHQETMDLRYIYSDLATPHQTEEGWVEMERYQWEVAQLRRVTLQRDPVWFQASQADLEAFWKDVEAARLGTWSPPPPLRAKKAAASGCAIVASDSDKEVPPVPSAPVAEDDVSLLTISVPVPKHGNA